MQTCVYDIRVLADYLYILYLQSKQRTHTLKYTHVQSFAHRQKRAVQRSCVEIDKQQSDKHQFVSCVTYIVFFSFFKVQKMIEQILLTRSDIASTAPNAQQEPHEP